jgi:hypothetical protein
MRWAVEHHSSHTETAVSANSFMDLIDNMLNHRFAWMMQEFQKILKERGQSNKGLLSSFQQSQSAASKVKLHSCSWSS